MLESLKSQVKERTSTDIITEGVNETPDDVKDRLLADEEVNPMDGDVSTMNEEDDPEIADLVSNLPETEDGEDTEYTDSEMDSITEAFTRL